MLPREWRWCWLATDWGYNVQRIEQDEFPENAPFNKTVYDLFFIIFCLKLLTLIPMSTKNPSRQSVVIEYSAKPDLGLIEGSGTTDSWYNGSML